MRRRCSIGSRRECKHDLQRRRGLRGETRKHKDTSLIARYLVQRGEAQPVRISELPRATRQPTRPRFAGLRLAHRGSTAARVGLSGAGRSEIVANDFLFGVATSGWRHRDPAIVHCPALRRERCFVRVLPPVRVNVGGLVLLYSSTRPLARKIAAFRDCMIEVTQREWVGGEEPWCNSEPPEGDSGGSPFGATFSVAYYGRGEWIRTTDP
jgi:hypothetical protein